MKKELLARLKQGKPKKESRMLYISEDVWAALVEWGQSQDPPQKPSPIIEELVKMFLESKK